MTVLLGLAAALLWGSADTLALFATRRIGSGTTLGPLPRGPRWPDFCRASQHVDHLGQLTRAQHPCWDRAWGGLRWSIPLSLQESEPWPARRGQPGRFRTGRSHTAPGCGSPARAPGRLPDALPPAHVHGRSAGLAQRQGDGPGEAEV